MEERLFINGDIPKSYFRLAIPNVLSMVVTLFYVEIFLLREDAR